MPNPNSNNPKRNWAKIKADLARRKDADAKRLRQDIERKERDRRERQAAEQAERERLERAARGETEGGIWISENFEWEAYPELWCRSEFTFSDYSGSMVERANAASLKEMFPNLFEVSHGGHGTEWWGINDENRRTISDEDFDRLKEVIEGLEDYPVIDDGKLSEMEWEAKAEYWKEDGRNELRAALIEKEQKAGEFELALAIAFKPNEWFDGEFKRRGHGGQLWEIHYDEYMEIEQGGTPYFRADDMAKDIVLEEFYTEEELREALDAKFNAEGNEAFVKATEAAGIHFGSPEEVLAAFQEGEKGIGLAETWEIDRPDLANGPGECVQMQSDAPEKMVAYFQTGDVSDMMKRRRMANDPNQLRFPFGEAKQLAEALLQEESYKLSTTQVDLPKALADFVIKWGRTQIKDDDLYYDEDGGCGREDEQHISVLYGITADKPSEELREIVRKTKPFTIRLGNVSLFKNDKFDVVKVEVHSEELKQLSDAIRQKCPNENKYPKYVPHCTVAYVKHGRADDLEGEIMFTEDCPVEPEFEAAELVFKGAGDSDDPKRTVEHLPFNRYQKEALQEAESPKKVMKQMMTGDYKPPIWLKKHPRYYERASETAAVLNATARQLGIPGQRLNHEYNRWFAHAFNVRDFCDLLKTGELVWKDGQIAPGNEPTMEAENPKKALQRAGDKVAYGFIVNWTDITGKPRENFVYGQQIAKHFAATREAAVQAVKRTFKSRVRSVEGVIRVADSADPAYEEHRKRKAKHERGIAEATAAEIDKAAAKTEPEPTDAQKETGNYAKGHIDLHGFDISIENAKGSERSGKNKQGKEWSVTMPAHYGYIKGTKGPDKDHLDVYIGEEPESTKVFVVNQAKEEGGFDEHKIMLGFDSKEDAIACYDKAFTGDLGPKLREEVIATDIDGLKAWIKDGDTKKPFPKKVEEAELDQHAPLSEAENPKRALRAIGSKPASSDATLVAQLDRVIETLREAGRESGLIGPVQMLALCFEEPQMLPPERRKQFIRHITGWLMPQLHRIGFEEEARWVGAAAQILKERAASGEWTTIEPGPEQDVHEAESPKKAMAAQGPERYLPDMGFEYDSGVRVWVKRGGRRSATVAKLPNSWLVSEYAWGGLGAGSCWIPTNRYEVSLRELAQKARSAGNWVDHIQEVKQPFDEMPFPADASQLASKLLDLNKTAKELLT